LVSIITTIDYSVLNISIVFNLEAASAGYTAVMVPINNVNTIAKIIEPMVILAGAKKNPEPSSSQNI
jgi:hypothetical protein